MGVTSVNDTISLTHSGKVVIATIRGGLFHEEKVILATLEKLGAAIDARKNVQMVVDMSTVEYLSSAGLGRLVGLLKKAVTGGGAVHFACLRPEIRELFEVMQLTKILKLFPTVEAAVAAYGAPSQ